jgi:peroxiredoxin
MAQTPSQMLALGTPAPAFRLPDTDGRLVGPDDFPDAAALLVMFICNHCPFVVHVAPALARLGRDYQHRGLAILAINSNDDDAYPQDGPAAMRDEVQRRGYTFPYLFDATQAVAKDYQAACTPDFYLFDRDRRLCYRGQLDDTRPFRIASGHYDSARNPPHGADLRAAIDAALAGLPAPAHQRPSIGCNIKWRPNNAPPWFG